MCVCVCRDQLKEMASLCKNVFAFNPWINNSNKLLPRNFTLVSQPCASISTRKLSAKLGIPESPKRPLTPFLRFAQANRPALASQYPEMKVPEIQKKLGEMWKTYDATEKERMKAEYDAEQKNYTHEIMEYNQTITESQKELLKEERSKIRTAKEEQKKRTRISELGRPKKPPPAFVLYMQSRLHERSKDVPYPNWLETISSDWKELQSENKQKWKTEATKLMDQYKSDMIVWETKMVNMGYIDVLRKQVLLNLTGKPKSLKKNENIPKTDYTPEQ